VNPEVRNLKRFQERKQLRLLLWTQLSKAIRGFLRFPVMTYASFVTQTQRGAVQSVGCVLRSNLNDAVAGSTWLRLELLVCEVRLLPLVCVFLPARA
jgi:hypothetical protein